jgi:GNAT superfamily N-acetyltransferase
MSAELRIRAAVAADVPVIVSLIHALAEYEKAAPRALSLTEERLRDALFGPHPAVEALVATADGALIGYALYFHNFSSWRGRRGLFLEDLFVLPEWRRHGLGRALFAELTRIAQERGCARIEWIVLDWNIPAIRFYQSLGAQPLNEWTTYRLDVS